jgi:hypothetical protein
MFGESKSKVTTVNDKLEHLLSTLDKDGFTVIPAIGNVAGFDQGTAAHH